MDIKVKEEKVLKNTIEILNKLDRKKVQGFAGFDGFIDEIVHVVDQRFDRNHYSRIQTIEEYSKRIARAAGLSTNIEVAVVKKKLGGNGPIFANALRLQDIRISYLGALGYPEPKEVFQNFAVMGNTMSISEPGYTDAVEFLDGKIIRSKLDFLNQLDWDTVKKRKGLEYLKTFMYSSDFAAFLNWSLMPNMNGIWRGILGEVLKGYIPAMDNAEKRLFVDLADPEKREEKELKEAFQILGEFRQYYKVILGVNKKEACELAEIYGKAIKNYQDMDIKELCSFLYENLTVDVLVIHGVKEACARQKEGKISYVRGPYCSEPRLTTGAGDHFNAGFMLGQTAGGTLEESLCTAVYLSGYYVRNARSPDKKELIGFMKKYCS